MRKYDYDKMTRALTFTEEGETRAMLVLLEMDWSYAQVLQFLRERDKWNEVKSLKVDPVVRTTKEDEAPVHTVIQVSDEPVVSDQVTDSVTTPAVKPAVKKKPA